MSSEIIQGILAMYQFTPKEGGQFLLSFKNEHLNNEFIPMLSEKDQHREANRILNKFVLKEGLLVFIYGIISIPLLRQLEVQKKENGGTIIVVEADPHLAVFYYKKFPDLFQNVWIVTSLNESLLDSILEQFQASQIIGYRILQISMSVKLCEHFYKEQEIRIKNNLSARFSDLLTRMEFQELWIRNALLQIPLFSKAYPIKLLFNKGQGQTAIIVSTGPSLRESLPLLKKYQDRFFIAVADSAYHVLLEVGIKPHLIITLDAQAFTFRHFGGTSFGEKNNFPILYTDLVANNQITDRWKGPIFMGMTAQYTNGQRIVTPGCDFIETTFAGSNITDSFLGDIQSGGSVATSLFDLLRQMNFDNIVLVGQDLAYTNREIHCSGTHHSKQWLSKNINRFESIENINEKVLKRRHIQYGTSIRGNNLPQDYILSTYKRWFEDSFKTIDTPVYNLTYDGSILEGTIAIHDLSMFHTQTFDIDYWLSEICYIAKKEDLSKLLRKIQNTAFSLSIENDYSFLNWIGYSYKTQANRTQDNNKKDSLLKKKEEQQARFWKWLAKK